MWETLLTGSDEAKYIIGDVSQPRSRWVYGGLINTSSIHPSIRQPPTHPPLHPPALTSIKPSLRCHGTPSALFTAISLSRRRWCRSRGSLAYFPRVPSSFSFILSFRFSFILTSPASIYACTWILNIHVRVERFAGRPDLFFFFFVVGKRHWKTPCIQPSLTVAWKQDVYNPQPVK